MTTAVLSSLKDFGVAPRQLRTTENPERPTDDNDATDRSIVGIAVISDGAQTGAPLDERDDCVDFGVGEGRDERFGRAAGDGVDLHELQLAAGGGDFVEAVAEGF